MRAFSDFSRHVRALCLKEMRQILRDKSAILLGVVLPVILIILFGHGLSFDVKDIRLAVVNSEPSENATLYTQALSANRSFIVNVYPDRTRAMQALERFDVEAVVVFEKRPAAGEVQLLVNGIDSPRATMVSNAVLGTIQSAGSAASAAAGINVIPRWERGTMEALLATPISPWALLLSKTIPYFVLGVFGWGLCMAAALFWYEVPVRGGLGLITLSSALYFVVCLAIGLVISGATRSQFLSSQIALLASFLPALILSGFIFDLRSAPEWANVIAYMLPPVYFMELLKVGFLTGGMHTLVIKNLLILSGYAVVFMMVARHFCQKRVRK